MQRTSQLLAQFIIVVVLSCGVAQSWLFNGPVQQNKVVDPEWDRLSVTYPKYNSLPMTEDDARKNSWTKTDSCDDNSYFRGNRYILKNEKTVMLLFDSAGKIAGIQFAIKKSLAVKGSYKKAHWVSDGDSFVITAYFVHPSVICSGTRKQSKYLGENLYVQLGPSSSQLMQMPLNEKDLELPKYEWVKGKCFYSMVGDTSESQFISERLVKDFCPTFQQQKFCSPPQFYFQKFENSKVTQKTSQHYWYNISRNMNCDDSFPVFLMYNGGKLNAFGWATSGDVVSPRVEHPTPSVFRFFFDKKTLPMCMEHQGVLTTQHIFLQRRPYLNFC